MTPDATGARTEGVLARIGTLADRLRDRLGREFGRCRTCGKPTRSHSLGDGVQCHTCHVDGRCLLATDGGERAPRERIADYAELHPDAGVVEALGELRSEGVDPAEWRDIVAAALEADDPHAAVATGDRVGDTEGDGSAAPEAGSPDVNPGVRTRETDSSTPDDAETDGNAGTDDGHFCGGYARATPDDDPGETDEPLGESDTSSVRHTSGDRDGPETDLNDAASDGESSPTATTNPSDPGTCETDGTPRYTDLYLDARERADADGAFVPHEDVVAAFDAAGWGDVVDHLRATSTWTVWTPDDRETPLYAYTPDLAGDTAGERERLVELLAGADADTGTERFIDVLNGQKASFDTGNARAPDNDELGGNYGVKGGRGGDPEDAWLVDIDVDDYADAKQSNPHVERLRSETLAVASAHTTTDRPGHLYVLVDGDPRAVVRDVLGRDIENVTASFGEVRIKQQYVVGPGSEIVCGCDRCTDPDAPDHVGRYELANERPPVVWDETEFREFLEADPALERRTDETDPAHGADQDSDAGDTSSSRESTDLGDDADTRLELAKTVDDYVADALADARSPDDRSKADAALARAVAPWVGYDRRAIADVLDDYGTGKWDTRPDDSYRESVLGYACDRERSVDAYHPVPYWAVLEFALARDLVDESDLVERDSDTGGVVDDPDEHDGDTYRAFPSRRAYWGALDALAALGVDHGRGPDYESVLPPAVRDLSLATSGWDWRNAGREHDTDLSLDAARERTTDAIADAYRRHDHTLVEALPTTGKSYGAVAATAETDEPVTILTGRGRNEQYDQLKEWCDEHGLTAKTLPSFTRDCPTAAGEHGEEWRDTVLGWYRRGATPAAIHKFAEDVLGRPLPCQVDDEGNHIGCPLAHKWDFDPDEHPSTGEPWDVLIGHYTHGYKEKVTQGRTVVFDEFPAGAYETTLGGEQIQGAVSYWLDTVGDAVPFDDYTDLVENRADDTRRADALAWFLEDDAGALEPDESGVFDDERAHAAAPPAVFAILAGDDLGNGFESADLQDVGGAGFDREHGEVSILQPPSLDYTRGIVALDGTPTKRMWELSIGESLNRRQVLTDDERAEYIRDALNLNLVRTTEYVKPYNSPDHVGADRDAALLEGIVDAHDERPALITTTTARDEYDAAGVIDVDPDTGDVTDGPVDRVKWYGDVLGSNEFKSTRLGAVIGSNHYGDRFIKKWGAYAGVAVEREDTSTDGKGAALSYGTFGDDVLTHMREHETLQAAMRFGRDGNGAVVYVHTDTLPEWVPLAAEGRVLKTWSDGLKDVVAALEDLGTARAAEIAAHPAVDVGERQVLNHLERLRGNERDVVDRERDPEDGRRYVWRDDGLHRLGEHGDVELEPVDLEDLGDDEIHELARSSVYTWEFVHSTDTEGIISLGASEQGDHTPDDVARGVDPPPTGG